MTISTLSLFVAASASAILDIGFGVARSVGLDVDSWQTGDPTRSNFQFFSQALARLEDSYTSYIRSGFLSTAEGEWLEVKAREDFGVEVDGATYAAPTITITNSTTSSLYEFEQPGDCIAKATSTGKTFSSVEGGIVIAAGATVTIALIADEAGSDSTVGANEIDALVTALPGLSIVSSTSAGARDAQTPEAVREQCASSMAPVSPNGPLDAYEHIARDASRTGAADVTRARAVTVGAGGFVDVYLAGSSGPVLSVTLPLVQAAIEAWATPLGFTPTARNSAAVLINLAMTVKGDNLPPGYESLLNAAIVRLFADVRIGGLVALSRVYDDCHDAVPALKRPGASLVITSHTSDIELSAGQVPVLGTFAVTESA